MASFSEWSNNKMRQATGTAKTTGTPQKAQTFSAWSNQKLGKVDTQKNPASGNTAFERSGKPETSMTAACGRTMPHAQLHLIS